MVSLCFYFQVHQPWRLKNYSVFEIGKNSGYFDNKKNREILERISRKCYLPTNKLFLELLNKHPELKLSYSFSVSALEQFATYAPEVLRSFQRLTDTGRVEILDETSHHSLSFLYSKKEFFEQIRLHRNIVWRLFGQKPEVFRNTELIYNNELAKFIEDLGYKGILAEGADHILDWRSPNFLYKPKNTNNIKLLLKNYRLSDDVAFRFSNQNWESWPLNAETYAKWINQVNGNGNIINLFMDYETFGEHQWADTGIFNFLRKMPEEVLKNKDNNFVTPSEAVKMYEPVAELDIHNPISWADVERDLSAWLGNKMQHAALSKIYELESKIKATNNHEIMETWRNLQNSDNFYYMCTKWFNDGDVHKYFNPHESPYEAFISFMNVLNDLNTRLDQNNIEVNQNE